MVSKSNYFSLLLKNPGDRPVDVGLEDSKLRQNNFRQPVETEVEAGVRTALDGGLGA